MSLHTKLFKTSYKLALINKSINVTLQNTESMQYTLILYLLITEMYNVNNERGIECPLTNTRYYTIHEISK